MNVPKDQGCPVLLLEGQRPAEFQQSSNLPQHETFSNPDFDKLVQVCLIKVGAELCRTVDLQEQN